MLKLRRQAYGFTIVELLVVIVVISILAAITIVAYNGIQNRAADASVQSDLVNMNQSVMVSGASTGIYPSDETGLSTVGLKVTKASYGTNFIDPGTGYKYNALYCSTIPGYTPSTFAFVAGSKSGNLFSISGGQLKSFPASSWTGGWGTICPAILGVSAGNSAAGVWLYENSIWKVWLSS